MLQQVSWGQFSVFILILTGVYYLYVVMRYYREEVAGWMSHKRKRERDSNGRSNTAESKGGQDEAAPAPAANQAELFLQDRRGGQDDAHFRTMERAIAVIRQLITQGIENKLDRENLLDHIREVLSDYRELRGTTYDQAINNFLVRVCSSEFSLMLGEGELAELWK